MAVQTKVWMVLLSDLLDQMRDQLHNWEPIVITMGLS